MTGSDPKGELEALHNLILRHPEGVGIAKLEGEFASSISRRTLNRRLGALLQAGRIRRRGDRKGALYFPRAAAAVSLAQPTDEAAQFETPEGSVSIPLTAPAREVLEYVAKPVAARAPVGYVRGLLDEYVANRSNYLSDKLKAHLHEIGKPIPTHRASGTFVRDILNRLLIDLSWASSRLEGNTYSRLDTQRLIEFGQVAEGKDARETQMILNHKEAIEMLVAGNDEVGINRTTLLNLHAVLSENLMADPEASGRLRKRPVEIGRSVYTPPAVPQVVEESFGLITLKAAAIGDPFEQAFFLMVHVPYLQPFEDVNKRVSRLAANIPLIKQDLCPLSFVDVPESAYVLGTLGVYELTRVDLLRDVFVWAYERSCQKYVVVRDSVVEPDLFRMKYKAALVKLIGGIVREQKQPAVKEIRGRAESLVESSDLDRFVDLAADEFRRLYEGNIARYRIRPSEFWAWFNATQPPPGKAL
jgi:hypothetical protein